MSSRSARDNILAGGFVVTGVVVAVWVSFMLGQKTGMGATRSFTVRFPVSIGAPGIKRGSPVLLGGQQIGRVLTVAFYPSGEAAASDVDVKVEIPEGITLYDNAMVSLERPLLGSLSSINIADAGAEAGVKSVFGGRKTIDAGDIVPGRLAPPAFLAQAGVGEKQIAEVQHALANLDGMLTTLSGVVDRVAPQAEQGIADARRIVGDLRTRLDGWSQSVDRIAANIEAASAKLDPAITEGQAAVADARALIAEVQAIIADNRERVNNTLASLESAAAKVDRETVDTLNAALKDGRTAIDSLSAAMSKVSTLITEQTPNLRRTLANLRLMSDNLKLTAVEVRSQPWRALHAPTTKEVSTQALYDATRAYAEAASDVRAASETLQALTAGNTASTADAATIDQASRAITEAMVKYQQAEQRLMDVLIREETK